MGNPGKAPTAVLNNGAHIPLIGLGTASASPIDDQIQSAVLTAIEAGYRHFDTAAFYGSEGALGKALNQAFHGEFVSREDVFITTKLWCTDTHPDDVLPALQKSLRELQLDFVDLYLIHWPVRLKKEAVYPHVSADQILPVDIKSTWLAMEKCVELGLARAIGLSNFSAKKIQDLLAHATIPPAVNQVALLALLPTADYPGSPTSPTANGFRGPLKPWQHRAPIERPLSILCGHMQTHLPRWRCIRLGSSRSCGTTLRGVNVHVTAWSPLAAAGSPWGSNAVIENPVIREIAQKHGKTAAQVALRWGIEQGVSVIPKSYNAARIHENISIFDWKLDEEDHERIRGLPQKKILDGKEFVNPIDGPYKSLQELWDDEI